MQLVYLDESGNTGVNLNDVQQPVFVLCALIVPEECWQALEADLHAALDARIPDWKQKPNFEIHAHELRTGRGHFAGMPVANRIAIRDDLMKVAVKHNLRLIYRSVHKKKYAAWLAQEFGHAVVVHPYVAAFALISRCIDNYLAGLAGNAMGMLIADENKEIVADIEKSISVFRFATGPLRFGRIIEKGFFIESHKSLPLQLCDLFALSIRKFAECKYSNLPPKSIDETGITLARSILFDDHKHDMDVLEWLVKQHKPSAPASPKF